MLPLNNVAAGQLTYSVNGCGTATYAYIGVPISNVSPASTLVPSGSTSIQLSVQTIAASSCGYSTGSLADLASMKPFSTGQGGVLHVTTVSGLSPDPSLVNRVYVRCALAPDYVVSLQYRALPVTNPSPRIANWGVLSNLLAKGVQYAARYDLLADSEQPPIPASTLSQIRKLNPGTAVLLWMNAVEDRETALPESYYLHDVNGIRIQDWPGLYLLNLTNQAVGEYQANRFYQAILANGLMYDGCFFDSFYYPGIPNRITNYGPAHLVDADGDGKQDDQQTLNSKWRAGMLHMMSAWRTLLPNAYALGHLSGTDRDLAGVFNGDSMLFEPLDVLEGRDAFPNLLLNYDNWWDLRGASAMTTVESTPQSQIAYGYGVYDNWAGMPEHMPPGVLTFAQNYYPYMRFPLALSLMNDGYFLRDLGDMSMGYTDWWYDEYDFKLGAPLGPAAQISFSKPANLIGNSGLEHNLGSWKLVVNNDGQAKATAILDSDSASDGSSSVRIAISSAGTVNWHVELEQGSLPLAGGTTYQAQFWARADSPRAISVVVQGAAPSFPIYGNMPDISIGTSWKLYSASFVAPVDATDGRMEFWVGDVAGNVWLDDVQLAPSSAQVYRRDFTNGVVLLNGSHNQQSISLEAGLQRLTGAQAPRYQYMVDDSAPSFGFSGPWGSVTLDSGYRIHDGPLGIGANPPFYHCWQSTCHQLDGSGGTAQWNLNIPQDGEYTIQVWLPAAPGAAAWTKSAVYEVVASGNVIAAATVDQTTASSGDGLHMIATVNLTAAGTPILRVHNGGAGSLIADAVSVTSTARYNDGSPAPQVTLAPTDGIVLQRLHPLPAPGSRVNSVVNAASFEAAIASSGFVSIVGTGFAGSTRTWSGADFSGADLPLSLDGVSVTIDNKQAYVEYISPTQINVIAPDDDTVGQVQVQVTTPQGKGYAGTVLKQKLSPAFFVYHLIYALR